MNLKRKITITCSSSLDRSHPHAQSIQRLLATSAERLELSLSELQSNGITSGKFIYPTDHEESFDVEWQIQTQDLLDKP